jgi:hypothetical protein
MAWQCTPRQIAREVWRQIADTFFDQKKPPERPLYYHLDDNIVFDRKTKRPARNASLMLINRTGRFDERPGVFDGGESNYHLHNGQLVFAGTYLKTYTRLTSMEAANESARHAVSAILRHAEFQGDHPKTWNPEDYEFPDLRWLVDLDAGLYAKDLPHVLDALGTPATLLGLAKGRTHIAITT